MCITAESLATIRVLYRAPDTMALYGIPYDMRPGQSPRNWEWNNLADAKQGARRADGLWMAVRLIAKVDASRYVDSDDCLASAAADFASRHGLRGWNLDPQWEDHQRASILLTIPWEV